MSPPHNSRFRSREQLSAYIKSTDLGIEPNEMRNAFTKIMIGQPLGRDMSVGGVSGLSVGTGQMKAIWVHGGGYVFGSPNTHTYAATKLSKQICGKIFLPEYRLGPENAWPAQLEDIIKVLSHVEDKIVLVGDSAGGHLAILAALSLPEKVSHLILFSPNTDRTGQSETRRSNSESDEMNDDETDNRLFRMAAPLLERSSQQASPIHADLTNLPPTILFVGGKEVLLGDARLYEKAARAYGRDIHLHIFDDESHMFWQWPDMISAANIAFDMTARFIIKNI